MNLGILVALLLLTLVSCQPDAEPAVEAESADNENFTQLLEEYQEAAYS